MNKKAADQNTFQHPEEDDEEMTVTLELEDGTSVTCAVVTILTANKQDYIVLLPLEEDGENHGYKISSFQIRSRQRQHLCNYKRRSQSGLSGRRQIKACGKAEKKKQETYSNN